MKVLFHPGFATDQRRFEAQYAEVSKGLATRFRVEIDEAIAAVKASPTGAGHFVNTGSKILPDVRRRDLRSFHFFVLCGLTGEVLVFGSIIPSQSDPLTWLARFGGK